MAGEKSSSWGCCSFSLGCLFGMFLMLAFFSAGVAVAGYFLNSYIDKSIQVAYTSQVRPFVLENVPLPRIPKEKLIQEMDLMVKEYPDMSYIEKAKAFEKIFTIVSQEGLNMLPKENPNAPQGNP